MEVPKNDLVWPSIIHFHVIFLFSITILCLQLPICLSFLGNSTDQLALLALKANIVDDPFGILSSWNDSLLFCSWEGVTCGTKHQRVVSVNLPGQCLSGTISPSIGNLTFLRFLDLHNNSLHGQIPKEVGRLFRLQHLNLSNNALVGELPSNISFCSELRTLGLVRNKLSGKIPNAVGSLKKLVILRLGGNKFIGEIPHSFGNLSSLEYLTMSDNHLVGNIPSELGRLTSLTFLAMGINNLTGTIPAAIFNISSLNLFSVPKNQLTGIIPENIGLPNLQLFQLDINQFHGTIPASLSNASQLKILDLSENGFTGQVPFNLGFLNSAQQINLELNFLGENTSQDLSFITSLSNCSNLEVLFFTGNNLGGALPTSIANLSTKLGQLGMGYNQISGRLPVEVGNLVNLYALGMERNLFSGPIPISFGKLRKLQLLSLERNQLSGEIPTSLGNLTLLSFLTLHGNKLEGNITSSIGKFENLYSLDIAENNLTGYIPQPIISLSSLSTTLNLSHNSFIGPLPAEVGNLKNINALDLSNNKLSGEIPTTVGDCLTVETLNMQGNFFQGPIPSSLASLRGLKHLDLSKNYLSGNIPKEVEKLAFLQYLNLSFNNLDGEVPKKGVFSNVSAFSLGGNNKLCGGIPELRLPACKPKEHKRSPIVIILPTAIGSIVLFITAFFCIFYWRNKGKNPSSEHSTADGLPRISYKDLLQATGGFSSSNLIGQGSFGSVYKGSLDEEGGRLIAVKVFNLQQHGASKSFKAECTALRNIRHRNLVKILTDCSSIDYKGNDFKALVFDFMENGNLDMWLHPERNVNFQSKFLNLLQRLRIAIEVSFALNYLHDHSETPVIHCDLKPSNILLDKDMTAHVGDFGLARLFSKTTRYSSQGQTSTLGIKGTIGYMAPEYGVCSGATTRGDMYSFGIILLEMFTGRRPTDEMFTGGLNLHNFVKGKLPGQVMEVVDPILLMTEDYEDESDDDRIDIQEDDVEVEKLRHEGDNMQRCIASVLRIGVACSTESPGDRMNISDVTRELNATRDAFLRMGTPRHQRTTKRSRI